MWRVILLAVIQSSLLAGGQVFLKFALQKMLPFGWTRTFWLSLLLNWQFACSGVIRIEFHFVVVYRETLPIECCLSDDKFELCVWSNRSNALFP